MNATRASSAAPPHAIKIWAEGLLLCAEIPGDPPYVITEAMTEGGLWKLLNLLRERAMEHPVASRQVPERMMTRKPGKEPVQVNQAMRDSAREVLKKLGMI